MQTTILLAGFVTQSRLRVANHASHVQGGDEEEEEEEAKPAKKPKKEKKPKADKAADKGASLHLGACAFLCLAYDLISHASSQVPGVWLMELCHHAVPSLFVAWAPTLLLSRSFTPPSHTPCITCISPLHQSFVFAPPLHTQVRAR